MKNWVKSNYKGIIISAFLIPIITVAIVSISHVTVWYGISNPISWAVYLSIGIEIAALSALAAISADMGSKVYFPFGIVTLVQFIGNIYFSYQYIQLDSETFKDWVELVSPLLEYIGVEADDYVGHKRFLSLFAGGMLPIISLSFLHMLVKFTQENKFSIANKIEKGDVVDSKELMSEITKLRLSDEDLKNLEEALLNPPKPNENLKDAIQNYKEKVNQEVNNQITDSVTTKKNEDISLVESYKLPIENKNIEDDFDSLLEIQDKVENRLDNQPSEDEFKEYDKLVSEEPKKIEENKLVDEKTEKFDPAFVPEEPLVYESSDTEKKKN